MIVLYIIIYLAGFIAWYFFDKHIFPYEKGKIAMDFGKTYELTEKMQRNDRLGRCLLWPFMLSAVIILSPFALIAKIIKNKEEKK